MKIVLIGAGKVGITILEHITNEGHEVIVVDNKPKNVEDIINKFDVMGICGNGASYDILKNAEVNKADLVVAATSSDEVNILACLVSQKLGAKSTIARVRNYEYSNQVEMLKKDLGLTMTINPEAETAREISKILSFPGVISVESFAKGKVDLIELYIPEDSPLIGQSLYSLYLQYQIRVLVCAVQRNDEVFIPTGSFTFQAKDKVHITASSKSDLKNFLTKVELLEQKLRNVMIIGGGKISTYLGNELIKNKHKVKIIETSQEKCNDLSLLLPKSTIICADGSDQNVLIEEGIDKTDAIVCLTGSDEENIIISMFADKHDVKKIVTKINKSSFAQLMETVSDASIISPKDVTASKILSYIRAYNNKRGSNVITLYKLVNNRVEALEFIAKENKKLLNLPLKDIKLKENILVASIIRDGNVIIPSGNDRICLNDRVIIVTTNQYLDDLNNILE